MIFELNALHGTALVLVTHDSQLAARAQRVLRIHGGRMVTEDRECPAEHTACF